MFLKTTHTYCSKMFSKLYHNKAENDSTPERQKNGQQVLEMVKNIQVFFGKKNFTIQEAVHLLYVSTLLVRLGGLPCYWCYAFQEEPLWEFHWTLDGHIEQDNRWLHIMKGHVATKYETRASPNTSSRVKYHLPGASFNLVAEQRRVLCNFLRGRFQWGSQPMWRYLSWWRSCP